MKIFFTMYQINFMKEHLKFLLATETIKSERTKIENLIKKFNNPYKKRGNMKLKKMAREREKPKRRRT